MRPPLLRRRVLTTLGALLLFASGVGAALADAPPTTTAPGTSTTATTTAAATTTVAGATTTPTTTASTVASTTSAATTTMAATTTSPAPTTTQESTAPAIHTTTTGQRRVIHPRDARAVPITPGCSVAGLLLLLPHRAPLAIGAVATAATAWPQSGTLAYTAGGSLARASGVTVRGGPCRRRGDHHAGAVLRSVSLFAGTVTATRIVLDAHAVRTARFLGLTVNGHPTRSTAPTRIQLSTWGELLVNPTQPLKTADRGRAIAALAVHVLHPHAGLPAGAWVLVAAAVLSPGPDTSGDRLPAWTQRSRAAAGGRPLKVTPALADRQYVFPVAGPSEYVDTYGGFRSDVPGNWHHGDDIFAPLGTPVVAVAGGTINRVGWEKLGGWRLWVRDDAGDEFYYAHLSGYTPGDLHSNHVQAGQVIGFIGNTGDAFTTSPHLHFEIHPRQLLRLHYNGAVDPTRYLDKWTHLEHVDVPRPTHPPLPHQPLLRKEARYVFRELLAARHLIKHAPKADQAPHVPIAAGANGPPPWPPVRLVAQRPANTNTPSSKLSTLDLGLITVLIALMLAAAILVLPKYAPSRRLIGRLTRQRSRLRP